jgi:hypothetical protein
VFAIDFIGDIHGNARALRQLLAQLGYRPHHGGYRHPEISRMAVFLGDYIDRGPAPLEVIEIVRAMRENGDAEALMGNHEFNALGFGTLKADGQPYRSHSSGAMEQHASFLVDAPIGSKQHDDAMRFFASLSIVYNGRNVRGIHAAWIDDAIAALKPHLNATGGLRRAEITEALDERSDLHETLRPLLKGPEIKVPKDMAWIDSHGSKRTKNRVRWWNSMPTTLRDAIILEGTQDNRDDLLPSVPRYEQTDTRPVLFGHYALMQDPHIVSPKATCIDFGADRGGHLVAYTFRGEEAFEPLRLTAIKA